MTEKTNITLKLDVDLLRAVKVLAAQRGTSVSPLLAEKFGEIASKDAEYDRAMNRSIARMNEGWDLGRKKPKSRDEPNER